MKTLTSLLKTCQMSYVILTYKTIKLKTLTCLSKTLIFIQFKNTVTGFLLFKNNAIGYRVIGSHSSQKKFTEYCQIRLFLVRRNLSTISWQEGKYSLNA